ncbi:hypothetical protein [Paraglaciecola algarum]|nr:hypothetical protein [Paraglaciecola sp. G1-23]
MLIFSPLETLTRTLTQNQAILSGCRNLEPLKAFWPWYDTKKNQQLKSYLSDTFNYTGPLLACLFIVVILPRKFFAYYEKNNYPFDAFLEYKIPSILAAMSIEIIENEQATPFWYAERHAKFIPCQKRNLIAVGQGVEPAIIAWNVNQENGRKLFHPVYISNDKVLSYIDSSSKYKITFSLLLLNVKLFCKYLIKKWF